MGISAVAVTFKWMSFITRNFNAVLAHQVSENNKKEMQKMGLNKKKRTKLKNGFE